MANKKLKGIIWPNIPEDTYILDAGEVEYNESDTFADATVGKALQNKANIDGSYSDLTAGNAEQLVSNVRVNDKTPYLFRTSGGSVDIGDREYINGIVGGTVAWNQQIYDGNFSSATAWNALSGATKTISNNEATIEIATAFGGIQTSVSGVSVNNLPTLISGHKYFISADIKASNNRTNSVGFGLSNYASGNQVRKTFSVGTSYANYAFIGTASATTAQADVRFMLYDTDGASSNTTLYAKNCMCFDLTQMFGSTIADYIYSLETATAGAGVAWFKKLFNKPYYAYNAGELKSVSGLVSHDMVGFNAWDEEWEVGGISDQTGGNITNNSVIRAKNHIHVLPRTAYYLKAPAVLGMRYYDADKNFIRGEAVNPNQTWNMPPDTHYIRFVLINHTTYNNDVCINISWDGSRDGEYEEYELHSYPLDSDLTLRGIPKLDANNSLYYDGDTYESDGTVTRRFGAITLDGSSDESWNYDPSKSRFYIGVSDINSSGADTSVANIISNRYVASTYSRGINLVDTNCITGRNGIAQVNIFDASMNGDLTTFKASLASKPLTIVYELATPTTETADPYQQTQIVNDFGTEEYVISDNTFAVPVGHDADYPVNLVAKLEMAPNSPEGNGDYIVRQTNGMNEYVPLVIEDALPTIPSTAGSYKLTVTVAEGSDPVLSWEAE